MSKSQSIEFMKKIKRNNDEDSFDIDNYNYDIDKYIKELFSYDIDKDGYLLFEDFIQYYYDLINKDLGEVWYDLKKLGYNNYLNENYDLDYLKNNK